ncbi:neurotrypsin isoform X2 [Marmota monax]|uniref:neurotrypsin isoform X2 n=1 Tax=Marmota monax TaxID=9995 RepID=UPI001EB07E16|nr:neurotrypsin isoform X2 [Marmota monax]
MTLASLVLALMLGALAEAVSGDPRRGYLHHRHPPPPGPQHQDSSPTPQRRSGTSPPLPRAVPARRAPGLFPGVCPAGAPGIHETARGARGLPWAEVPAFLERPPPEGWASLRGQRHNFCRSPDGAGAPWCFYRSAPGRADWGYCGCRHGPASPAIRLAGGRSLHEGRVELYRAGQWGTICDDQWDNADAEVVCRQLGFSGVAKAWTQAYFGEGSGPIMLDEVRCTGNELSIEQCPKSSWGEHNCGHREDAGVSCAPLIDGAIRLAGGRGSHEGRLEVHYQGQWGTICDDGWTQLNTRVACRQLGFMYGRQAPAHHFEASTGPIWLDDVHCSGREASFLQCSRGPWGRHDCSHREDVGITCHLGSKGRGLHLGFPVRLVDGENEKEGRVEVYVHGQWGTVCDDGWTDEDAAVVCRQLGHRNGHGLLCVVPRGSQQPQPQLLCYHVCE